MPRFNIFRSNKNQYISEDEFQEKMVMQQLMNSKVLQTYRERGGTREKETEVEFFFYTDSQDKGSNLAIELHKLGYEIYGIRRSSENYQWLITGRTPRMKMFSRTLTKWSKQMVALGYQNDCDFDGWQTCMK